MGSFTFDIRGQLNSLILSKTKALWPMFEAVVNSIQAIEDSPNKDCGKIEIYAEREQNRQEKLDGFEELGRFESFTIKDNGIGLDEKNYKSFNTAYSTLKISKGCKGIGRFLWLKAFENVEVKSVFENSGKLFKREFVFDKNGISPDKNISDADGEKLHTEIVLHSFKTLYRQETPIDLQNVANKLIEHCLPFFISGKCPSITIKDGETSIELNEFFEKHIRDSLHQDNFTISNHNFTIYHLCLHEGAKEHEIHFCANNQEVNSVELKKYIPNLQKKIIPKDSAAFYYVGYVTGKYLDENVDSTRTHFNYDDTSKEEQSLFGTGSNSLVDTAISYIKLYLKEYIDEIEKNKKVQIDKFVANERPTYRYLLYKKPETYNKIPAGLKNDELEIELYKQVQTWEKEIKMNGIKLEEAIKNKKPFPQSTYSEIFEQYWSGVTELSKTCLAEYIARRRALLSLLDKALTINDNGKFSKEEIIHSIICPMQHTSDDISFQEMNLWIVDESLAYHKYLASDKTLRSMPIIDSNSKKEPDIAVFNQAFAFSDNNEPFNTVTIIEFKKPDNDKKNPINQVGQYIDLISSGKAKRDNGQSFITKNGTVFRAYIICDLTDKMRTHCVDSSLASTVDNNGYVGYNSERKEYVEVISYQKLLADAKQRNSIFFDKLFSPNIKEIIHIPNL